MAKLDGVVKAKSELYEYMKTVSDPVIVNQDNELLMELAKDLEQITYGESDEATYSGELDMHNDEVSIILKQKDGQIEIKTHLTGSYNFENVMCSIAIGLHFGVDEQAISDSISNYIPANNRSQIINTSSNRILLDAYNANPTSMHLVIHSFINQDSVEKYLILGDMMELGQYAGVEHQEVVDLLINHNVKHVVLIGKQFSATNFPASFHSFPSTADAKAWLTDHPITNGSILIKGSRSMQLEELSDLF